MDGEGYLILDAEKSEDSNQLALIQFASAQNQVAVGERSGKQVRFLKNELLLKDVSFESELCANISEFSLHANVEVQLDKRDELEKLIRYFTRPPVVEKRLRVLENGDILCNFKRSWKNGTYAVKFSPLELIEKLASLVPLPRRHLFRYHGLLAPNSSFRSKIIPTPPSSQEEEHKKDPPLPLSPSRISWSELLKRVFHLDLTECPICGGKVRFISAIMKRSVIILFRFEILVQVRFRREA